MPPPSRLMAWAGQSLWGIDVGIGSGLACLAERRRSAASPRMSRLSSSDREGRLTARPGPATGSARLGLQRLGLEWPCDGLLYVPAGYRADRPAPFLLMLHGATSIGLFALWPIILFADAAGLIILAPDARGPTWDRSRGYFGRDVCFINRALDHVFQSYAIDPAHLAIGGFSDGASYALSLGLTNGDLFTKVIAFSPGFLAPNGEVGHPRVFVSHGTEDKVLSVVSTRQIVALLRKGGYDAIFDEFVGPHVVPTWIARKAVNWLVHSP